ncbi:hypothetical protein ACIQWY_30015 [Streptomyces albidoflavus]
MNTHPKDSMTTAADQPATNTMYWEVVAARAAAYTDALSRPGGDLSAGLDILLDHANDFGLACTTHVAQMCLLAVVAEEAGPDKRNAFGTVDLDQLVPPHAEVLTVLDNASVLSHVFAMSPAEAASSVEDQIQSTPRARRAVQSVLNAAQNGVAGRQQALDRLGELRDDPRALCAVLGVTAAAMRAVLLPDKS